MIKEFLFLGFPLCSREVRKIAHDFAEANGFEGFSKQLNEAGRKWFAFLLKRYPKLKVKEGVTNLSIARAKASNHDSVTTWYKKYQMYWTSWTSQTPDTYGTLMSMDLRTCQK